MRSHHTITARLTTLAAACLAATLAGCAAGPSPQAAKPEQEVKGTFAFWPVFPDEPRIQFVKGYNSSNDVSPASDSQFETMVFGKNDASIAEINKPYGVAMRDGKIYICDMRGSSLVVLDVRKQQTRLVGTTGANRLDHPVAAAIGEDGTIYVADNKRGAIVVFDANERYRMAMGFAGFKPASVAVHGDKVYASDMGTQSVQIFDAKTGVKSGSFGSVGDGDGQFRLPLGVATDTSGNVYVVDMMRCRVQKFTADGSFIAGMGKQGDVAGTFARPKHIAVDADGIIYVVDAAFENVQMFDDQFRLLMSFGAVGKFPGAMNMPAGICVCDDGLDLYSKMIHPGFAPRRIVLVANQFGDAKIGVYAMGSLRKGYTAADMAKQAASVSTGTGADAESLKFQQLGTQPTGVDSPNAPATPPAPDAKPAVAPR